MTPASSGAPQLGAPEPFDEGPVVGRRPGGNGTVLIVGGFAVLAVVLFLVLNGRRLNQEPALVATDNAAQTAAPAPPPLQIAAPAPPPPVQPIAPVPLPVAAPMPAPVNTDAQQRLHAPAVVFDLQNANGGGRAIPVATAAPGGTSALPLLTAGGGSAAPGTAPLTQLVSPASGAAEAGAALLAGPAAPSSGGGGGNEQFATRVSNTLPEPAVATQLTGLSTTITQGATIPGVLETALNSDLPGYTRAVVSRDVRSFDGKAVLIPRGSRLIGQYRSALSLGQERVFVIWTRVIRPDGVSIQIGSPGGDALGRGGLTGDVETHFFARFGSSILLSVLSGGVAAIAGTPSTQISIGSPAAAAGTAATAITPTGNEIMPTVKVKQGVAVIIFVARDLDFSAVKPVP